MPSQSDTDGYWRDAVYEDQSTEFVNEPLMKRLNICGVLTRVMMGSGHDNGDYEGANHDAINREVVRIANLMLHDGISADEQDHDKLEKYVRQVNLANCNIRTTDNDKDEMARSIVYEALLYRKLKGTGRVTDGDNGNRDRGILEKSSEFGAGFS